MKKDDSRYEQNWLVKERLYVNNKQLKPDLNRSRAFCWEWDLRNSINTWSDALWPVYGHRSDNSKPSYESWLKSIHQEDRDQIISSIEAATDCGKELNIEWRINPHIMPDNCEKWFMLRGVPEYDKDGKVIRYMGIVLDITEQKQAKEHLEQYKNIISSTPDAIAFMDENYRYVIVNDAYKKFSGVSREDLSGLKVVEVLGEEHFYGTLKPHLDRCLKGEVINYEEWFECPVLGKRFVEVSYFPYMDSSSKITGVIANRRDITERKRVEEVQSFLAKTSSGTHEEPFFNLIVRYLAKTLGMEYVCIGRLEGDGLTITTVAVWCDGKFENNMFYTFTDTPCTDVVGKDVCCFPDNVRQAFPENKLLKNIEAESYVGVTLWSHNRQPIGLISAIGKKPIANRRLAEVTLELVGVRVSGVLERIDAEATREKLQKQLNHAQKMESIGRLAGGVAHDFNNMLGVILGYTEMALARVEESDPLHADLKEIFNAATHSADLTRQLLAFASKQTVTPKVLDLNKTLSGMLKMLKRLIGEDIDLTWASSENQWLIKVDPSQIDQILANLCINAKDAISGFGRITIETANVIFDESYCSFNAGYQTGEYVMISVKDDGCGMNNEILQNLFEPFFTTKERSKGTGLGLATVYGIVRQNNGFIKVYSEPSKGSTFNIFLPRYMGKSSQMQKEDRAEPATRGHGTILLVEDQQSILKMVTVMLERLGYTVLSADTPGKAIQLAIEQTGDIDLLLTDVVMPEMSGRDLAINILSLYPKTKPIFMSGYTADVIANQGVLDEGVLFIQKPFSMHDLANMVREVMDSK